MLHYTYFTLCDIFNMMIRNFSEILKTYMRHGASHRSDYEEYHLLGCQYVVSEKFTNIFEKHTAFIFTNLSKQAASTVSIHGGTFRKTLPMIKYKN